MSERIRPSATVILHRVNPHVEVYLVKRAHDQRFFPGYHAFPGGTLDKGEDFPTAAIREVEEETGVRIPNAGALTPAGRLLTPPFGPTRYDTQFYVARLPEGADPRVTPGELESGAWWRPADALARWHRGEMLLPPPTLAFLRILDATGSVDRMAAAARATDGLPHHERFRIELHPRVSMLPLRAPTLPPATTQNCYFFEGPEDLLVVDPGTPFAEEQDVLAHVTQRLLDEGRRASAILLTHHHPDHVAAAQHLKTRFGFPVLAHAETAKRLPGLVDREIGEGDAIDLGHDARSGKPWRVRALHTPGHAPGHLAFVDERFGAVVAGDLVSGVSTILVDPPEGNMRDYMASLARLAAMEIAITLPGHGPALPGRRAFEETLKHRAWREQKVLDALPTEGSITFDALLAKVYDDTPPEAMGIAERSLKAHLEKLAAEGRARETTESWARVS